MGQSSIDYPAYRRKTDKMGDEYENFVYPIFCKEWGVKITPYKTREEQLNIGENSFGVEIKYDEISIDSPNIYIEVAEKGDPDNLYYVDSGIYRGDNAWLYLIGNYNVLYVFLITRLRKLIKDMPYRFITTATSKGYLMPQIDARVYALDVIIPKGDSSQVEIFDPLKPFPSQI